MILSPTIAAFQAGSTASPVRHGVHIGVRGRNVVDRAAKRIGLEAERVLVDAETHATRFGVSKGFAGRVSERLSKAAIEESCGKVGGNGHLNAAIIGDDACLVSEVSADLALAVVAPDPSEDALDGAGASGF